MKITFVRHGETEENLKKILTKPLSGKLTRKGREQARKLAKRLAKEKFDIIYCSDANRTKETAKEILKYQKNVPIMYTRELRELHQGEFDGKKSEELWREFLKSGKNLDTFKPKGGESRRDLRERINKFFKKVYQKHKGKHVLLITHGGVNRGIWYICKNMIPKFSLDHKKKTKQDNCCVNILEFKRGKPKLVLYNCTKHLKGSGR